MDLDFVRKARHPMKITVTQTYQQHINRLKLDQQASNNTLQSENLRSNIMQTHLNPEEDETWTFSKRTDCQTRGFERVFRLLEFRCPVMTPVEDIPELLADVHAH